MRAGWADLNNAKQLTGRAPIIRGKYLAPFTLAREIIEKFLAPFHVSRRFNSMKDP